MLNLSEEDKEVLIPAGLVGIGIALAYFLGKKVIESTFPLSYPVAGRRITSGYGYRTNPVTGKTDQFHNGIDIAATVGEPVRAPADGQVLGLSYNSVGGNQLLIRHTNGWHTGYAHLNGYVAKAGQPVKRGQLIAYAGKTGSATGPHLHFVVSNANRESQDPLLHLAKS